MSNSLNYSEILRLCLLRSNKPATRDPAVDSGGDAVNARLVFKSQYDALAASFPWPFMTKKVDLKEDSLYTANPPPDGPQYPYRYVIPNDAKFIWDLFKTTSAFTGVGFEGAGYTYFDVALGTAFSPELAGSDIAEYVDGFVYSNVRPLKILYTSNSTVDPLAFSVNFTQLLMMDVIDVLKESRQVSPEQRQLDMAANKSKERELLHKESLQNRFKDSKIEDSETLRIMERF